MMIKDKKTIAVASAPIAANTLLPVSTVNLKRFISFSGGVESTTMCVLFGKGATAIWCDTGAEHDLMYQRIDEVEKELKIIHDGKFELVRVKSEKHIGLEQYANKRKFMPSGQARYCTRLFKIEPIDSFLETQGECELMIGFNIDEDGRTGNLELKANVKYTYPLIEAGLTREDCEETFGKSTQIDPLPPKQTTPLAPFQTDPLIPAQTDPLKRVVKEQLFL